MAVASRGAAAFHEPDHTQPVENNRASADRLHDLGCALTLAAAYLLIWPVTSTGVLDDWSFARTALDLLRTGELRYNGWAAPMIGAQAWVGAVSAQVFGPTLTAVRLTMLPLAILTTLVLRALLRYAGVEPARATFGALAFGLSPVVLPLSTSFMTDLPALLSSLFCALALVRAAESVDLRPAATWVVLAAVAGALGGSVRQTAWLAPMVMLPCFAAFERRRPQLAMLALVLAAASALLAVEADRWLAAQPYIAEVKSLGVALAPMLQGLPQSLDKLPSLIFTTFALLLPLSFARIVDAAWNGDATLRVRLAAAGVIGIVTAPMLLSSVGPAPWLSNLLCTTGLIGAGLTVVGESPRTLAPMVQDAIAVASYASMPLLAATMSRPFRRDAAPNSEKLVVYLLLGFTIAYSVVLVLHTYNWQSFDRYLVPVLPCAIVLLLRRRPDGASPSAVLAVGALLVACWGIYGIAITHDMFSTLRARRAAFDLLLERGAAPTSISAGFEIDGLTEIDAKGFLSNPSVKNPPGARWAYRRRNDLPIPFWFLNFTPSIQPRWWITLSPIDGFRETEMPAVEYTTWLPPGRRRIHVIETP